MGRVSSESLASSLGEPSAGPPKRASVARFGVQAERSISRLRFQ